MSTDEYVPDDEDVYGVWTNYQCFGAGDGYGPRGIERAAAEMDRYLARVCRDAWQEGCTTGFEDALLACEIATGTKPGPPPGPTPNPHKETP